MLLSVPMSLFLITDLAGCATEVDSFSWEVVTIGACCRVSAMAGATLVCQSLKFRSSRFGTSHG